jgi:1-acyl-sn-glycerol-3-phosphate acyltransferase
MHKIIFEEPYEFVPPHCGNIWPRVFGLLLAPLLKKSYGVVDVECRGTALLRESLTAGHGIILAANHSRPCDPFVMGLLARQMSTNLHLMASWSVFKQSRLQTFVARRVGAFSVYREGMDRASLTQAIDTLVDARRPLVIFPEGVISRANDRLGGLMDGTAFMARQAARKRAKVNPDVKVVIHPVAIKYQFLGNLNESIEPVLKEIEDRFTWGSQSHLGLFSRITLIGAALIALKEIEFLGEPQTGSVHDRVGRLVDHLLVPLESEWMKESQNGDVVTRVKNLRTAILPDMVEGDLTDEERDRRWRQLADLYLAQQLWFYPAEYVAEDSPAERILETVERFEEDLTDTTRIHAPLRAIVQVGDAIEVGSDRPKRGLDDPLMVALKNAMQSMLESLSSEVNQQARGDSSS